MPAPFLSIILPAFNEANRLPKSLEQLLLFVQTQPYEIEIIVVENGSTDDTYQIAQAHASQNPQIRAFHNAERGKGLAVKRGMLEARGQYRFMCDVDLSMPPAEISRFIPPVLNHCDIAIASREGPGAMRFNEPAYRHFVGRCFNTLIRVLALPGLMDTQCGFKCLSAQVAEEVFSLQTLTGWSFDVEMLFIARRLGYHIVEVPIPWFFNPESKIRVLKDSLRMGMDLLKIRLNDWQGKYAPKV